MKIGNPWLERVKQESYVKGDRYDTLEQYCGLSALSSEAEEVHYELI